MRSKIRLRVFQNKERTPTKGKKGDAIIQHATEIASTSFSMFLVFESTLLWQPKNWLELQAEASVSVCFIIPMTTSGLGVAGIPIFSWRKTANPLAIDCWYCPEADNELMSKYSANRESSKITLFMMSLAYIETRLSSQRADDESAAPSCNFRQRA